MKYIKYKTIAHLTLTGDDDIYASNTNSAYKTNGSTYTNAKLLRFNLNGELT